MSVKNCDTCISPKDFATSSNDAFPPKSERETVDFQTRCVRLRTELPPHEYDCTSWFTHVHVVLEPDNGYPKRWLARELQPTFSDRPRLAAHYFFSVLPYFLLICEFKTQAFMLRSPYSIFLDILRLPYSTVQRCTFVQRCTSGSKFTSVRVQYLFIYPFFGSV